MTTDERAEPMTLEREERGWTDALRAACNSRTVEVGDRPCWQDSALMPCLTCWEEAVSDAHGEARALPLPEPPAEEPEAQEGEREDG